MNKVIVKKFTHAEVDSEKEVFGFLKIPTEHRLIRAEGEDLEVSDGYHTFDELYEHRIALFIQICKMVLDKDRFAMISPSRQRHVWRSKLHSDGSSFDGWFILGINEKPGEQMTYHLPLSKWKETDFAFTEARAPEYDGHTSEDVLKRLKEL